MNPESLERILGAVHALLVAEDMVEAANIVRNYPARAEQTGYDNWNGGTELWTVFIELPPASYARLGSRREHLENQISSRLKIVIQPETQDRYAISIVPSRDAPKNWRVGAFDLREDFRRSIVDGLRLGGARWQGQLNDVEFLSRIYDLKALPSTDSRFTDASGDIWQHAVSDEDWDVDWVFFDKRFNLLNGSSEPFLRFLC